VFTAPAVVVDKNLRTIRTLAPIDNTPSTIPTSVSFTSLGSYAIGALRPHRLVTIAFVGRFDLPRGAQFAGGQLVSFQHLHPKGPYYESGDAKPGDRLRLVVLPADTEFQPAAGHIQLALRPHLGGRYITVSGSITSFDGGTGNTTIDPTIINASLEAPIAG